MSVRTDAPTDLDALLADATFYADPYPVLARVREESPVHWHPQGAAWLIAKYDDVEAVFRDPHRFSSYGFQNAYFEQLRPELREAAPTLERRGRAPTLITSDPPAHTRLRRLLQGAFTPKAIDALRPKITTVVDELLTDVDGASVVDFIATLAYPLPAIIIAEILGVRREDRDRFKQVSNHVLMFMNRADPNTELTVEFAQHADRSLADFREYLRGLIAASRREPGNDVIDALVHADFEGERLDEEELLANLILFLIAGHETTTNLIGNAIFLLHRHPTELERLRGDLSLMPAAIEEVLRYEAPVQRLRRVVAKDVDLAGVRLRPGEPAEVLIGAANRDPLKFEEPDVFTLERPPSPNLTFGKGVHFCIGAPLARVEASVALTSVLSRFSELRLLNDWQPSWIRTTNLRGLTALPVEVASS